MSMLLMYNIPMKSTAYLGKFQIVLRFSTKESFIKFVNNNSQANEEDVRILEPPHYLFPKFKTILEPKHNTSNYDEKVKYSLVWEFNRTQREAGRDVISSQSALNWLKEEQPKIAIYPHQSDYCDYCSKIKVEIQGYTQSISRHLQSGNCSVDNIEEFKKEDLEKDREEHWKIARKSLRYYHKMKDRCSKEWNEIIALESDDTSEQDEKHEQLKRTFTLLLSADYLSKLLPY